MALPMQGMVPGMMPQASLGTATMTTGSLSMGPRMANGAIGSILPSGSIGGMPISGESLMFVKRLTFFSPICIGSQILMYKKVTF